MPTPTKGPRLASSPAHERLMLANLATQLFEHGAITTTEARAKRGDLHARRQVMTVIRDKSVVHVLFTEIGPRFATRQGGYTRITKIGPRKGDNAPMAVIELCEPLPERAVAEATAATRRAAKERQEQAATSAPVPAAAPAEVAAQEAVTADEVGAGAVDTGAEAADAPVADEAPAAGEPTEDADKA